MNPRTFWLAGALTAAMAIRLATITPGYEHGTDTATNTTATTEREPVTGRAAKAKPKAERNQGDRAPPR